MSGAVEETKQRRSEEKLKAVADAAGAGGGGGAGAAATSGEGAGAGGQSAEGLKCTFGTVRVRYYGRQFGESCPSRSASGRYLNLLVPHMLK